MFPILFSLIAASLFGMASLCTYGAEGFIDNPWIIGVLLIIPMVGITVTLFGEFNQCLHCRLKAKYSNVRWLGTLCDRYPCL